MSFPGETGPITGAAVYGESRPEHDIPQTVVYVSKAGTTQDIPGLRMLLPRPARNSRKLRRRQLRSRVFQVTPRMDVEVGYH